jgi:hypothetical protein
VHRFKRRLPEAYAVLNKPDKRAEHDYRFYRHLPTGPYPSQPSCWSIDWGGWLQILLAIFFCGFWVLLFLALVKYVFGLPSFLDVLHSPQ